MILVFLHRFHYCDGQNPYSKPLWPVEDGNTRNPRFDSIFFELLELFWCTFSWPFESPIRVLDWGQLIDGFVSKVTSSVELTCQGNLWYTSSLPSMHVTGQTKDWVFSSLYYFTNDKIHKTSSTIRCYLLIPYVLGSGLRWIARDVKEILSLKMYQSLHFSFYN